MSLRMAIEIEFMAAVCSRRVFFLIKVSQIVHGIDRMQFQPLWSYSVIIF